MRKQLNIFLILLCSSMLNAQTGGLGVYNFLNLPASARTAAMGGKLYSIYDHNDPSLAITNPALLEPKMHQGIAFQFVDYFSDAAFGHINYIHDFKKVGTFNFAFQFMSYGKFDGYDEMGNETGSFTAGDFALITGYGKELIDSTLYMGVNLKWIFSAYETYFSTGLAADVSATYYNPKKNICLTLLATNIGSQIKTYAGIREKMPFDLQLGLSQRLKHAPFRYNITLHHLYTWDFSYTDLTDPFAERDIESGSIKQKTNVRKFTDNLFRHVIIGIEILPTKYFSLQFAYNYNTRQEMKAYARKGAVGFSYGVSLHLFNFNLQYARAHNNLASTPNYITLSTNITNFLKK